MLNLNNAFFVALMVTLVTSISNASVMYTQADQYRCSDGETYDVARSYMGGYGAGSFQLVGFCSGGTLWQKEYGRFFGLNGLHPDIKICATDTTPAVLKCFKEFRQLNPSQGPGKIPKIISSHETSAESQQSIGGYEIRPKLSDKCDQSDNKIENRMKMSNCLQRYECGNGYTYMIPYKSQLGYSKGTKVLGMCRIENADGLESCMDDNHADTLRCWNEAVDRLNLPKAKISDEQIRSLERRSNQAPSGSGLLPRHALPPRVTQ